MLALEANRNKVGEQRYRIVLMAPHLDLMGVHLKRDFDEAKTLRFNPPCDNLKHHGS